MTLPFSVSRPGVAIALVAAGVLLTGCTAAVPLQPAPDATNATCADLIVRLPAAVADQPERETNAQSTGAWGDPAVALLHCGVDVPGPTTLPCLNIDGIDWIMDESDAPRTRFTTYGRDPATEVVVDTEKVSGSTVLVDLASAVSIVPATNECLGVDDLPTPAPTP